jgi:single-stranded-DNA-specific exonuclease
MSQSLRSKIWEVCTYDRSEADKLTEELKISRLLSVALLNRGISDPEMASRFLWPKLSHLHPPFTMKGMEKAVARIMRALASHEKVAVYGDYDADGVTAAALLYLFLRRMGLEVECYLPHRLKEGYGLNREAVRRMAQSGVSLIITVDCGISNVHEAALASSLHMDVIVTDHHEPSRSLPQAFSILNPKQPGCPYPFKDLAGVGIAFLLVVALRAAMKESGRWNDAAAPNLKNFLDLVALGTIADQVPLIDQNRILAFFGLEVLNQGRRKGIEALKEVCGLSGRPLSSWNAAFQLAPRLNAGGRMGDSYLAFRLLTTEEITEAREIAVMLDKMNAERQSIEDRMVQEAEAQLRRVDFSPRNKTIVLASKDWHKGIAGIVASRILERYFRPTIIISLEGELGYGSGRSVPGLNLYHALEACSSWLSSFGGHPSAAGITIDSQNITPFSEQFERVADQCLKEEHLLPRLKADGVASLDMIGVEEVRQLKLLEPFGNGNPEPLWLARELAVHQVQPVAERHLRLLLRPSENHLVRAIGFDMIEALRDLKASVDAIFTFHIDEWGGASRLEIKLKDIRNAASKD